MDSAPLTHPHTHTHPKMQPIAGIYLLLGEDTHRVKNLCSFVSQPGIEPRPFRTMTPEHCLLVCTHLFVLTYCSECVYLPSCECVCVCVCVCFACGHLATLKTSRSRIHSFPAVLSNYMSHHAIAVS